jgi:hypothetical protein
MSAGDNVRVSQVNDTSDNLFLLRFVFSRVFVPQGHCGITE